MYVKPLRVCACLQVAAFHMLTGWPQEDLLDALGGTPAAGGFLFDRLEDVLPGPTKQITVRAHHNPHTVAPAGTVVNLARLMRMPHQYQC